MASWVRSWQEYGEDGVPHIPLKESAPNVSSPSLMSEEVVRVLAGMVWALRKEA